MKPFNLEEAKAGKPITNRLGCKIKLIAHIPEAEEFSRVVVFNETTGCVSLMNETGNFSTYAGSTEDLFMAPPPMLAINGHKFPEPERKPLSDGQRYFIVDTKGFGEVDSNRWAGSALDYRLLHRGMIHLTEEAAKEHYKAIVLSSGGKL